jgi:hypothetical protein
MALAVILQNYREPAAWFGVQLTELFLETKSALKRFNDVKLLRFLLALVVLTPATSAIAGELGGSRASVRKAHSVARRNEYTFLRTSADVRRFIAMERLVRVHTNADFTVKSGMAFPYARPAVKLFIERLAQQYHAATGDRLVVTSLTRPLSRQPSNASALSVHPTGIAVDFRIPAKSAHRKWLERTLLSLEDKVVLDVTKERNPAHYHVAVFPKAYEAYVARLPN